MPSFNDLLDLARKVAEYHGLDVPEQFYADLSDRSRESWPGERIYLMPKNSRRDPARGEAITSAIKRLPTGIVSERLGVSRQLISYYQKKSKNPDG